MVHYRPSRLIVALSAIGTTVGGLVIFKDYIGGCRYYGEETMHGKTVIVTGSNCGIGKEVAREFAKRGAKVIMACRDINKCDKSRQEIVLDSNNGQVYCYKLDLASLRSVRKFAEEVDTKNSFIHLLVNNAGVMRCPHQLTEEGFELQLGVNHLGHFMLTNLLLDKLKLSAPSRIINVSSTAHYRGHIDYDDLNSDKHYDAAKAYSQSKLANVLFTKELANRLKGTEVLTFAVHPGIVNTGDNTTYEF
ncbi:retinol dehydrogenase 13-like [Limulus polyphemus]|uniref:Retinol dehydrogenase 13-like n=1 Tax=Limulus polyphemus TaxID=6850 RepID=A0ABM1TQM3_LIMPO|nr:retinol dehydrogenase 13-like [Limulus polyphemus]XP_022258179.1 retinol dehydrogenase 13-like [Limulus polyphemus]XP_022258180.1 retinol dehydrogenase 13-like [Limulus polyphemus]XP_022258181.1 retinol dehydrogenase 13-like [Limulus polyphemus]